MAVKAVDPFHQREFFAGSGDNIKQWNHEFFLKPPWWLIRMLQWQWQDMTRWQDTPGQARLLLHYVGMTIQSMSQVTCISRRACCQATPTARLSIAVCAAASCCWYWWSPCQQLRRVENARACVCMMFAIPKRARTHTEAEVWSWSHCKV